MLRQPRRKIKIVPPEQLELRILPTVKVNFNPGSGLLKITGDGTANQIDLNGTGTAGEIQVLINNVPFNNYTGVISIAANLKGGNDLLSLSAVQLSGSFSARLGTGADTLDIDAAIGNNTPTISGFGSFIKADFGDDVGDFLEIDDALIVFGTAAFNGVADADFDGDGTDYSIELGHDVVFASDLTIRFSGLGDVNGNNQELTFDNVYSGGITSIEGTNSIERFKIINSAFFGEFTANMDDGDDAIDIDDGAAFKNLFHSQTTFEGGDDHDTLLKGPDNIFDIPVLITGFETVV